VLGALFIHPFHILYQKVQINPKKAGGIMTFDIGFFVIGITMIIFYLRLAQIRGRKRKIAEGRTRTKGQKAAAEAAKNQPTYRVTSWWLVVLGGVLMLCGVALRTYDWFPADYHTYWWAVASAGVLVFVFCFK
jgi:hypothetical protein